MRHTLTRSQFPRRELVLVATARQIREDGTEHLIEREHNIRKTITEGITLSCNSNTTEIQ